MKVALCLWMSFKWKEMSTIKITSFCLSITIDDHTSTLDWTSSRNLQVNHRTWNEMQISLSIELKSTESAARMSFMYDGDKDFKPYRSESKMILKMKILYRVYFLFTCTYVNNIGSSKDAIIWLYIHRCVDAGWGKKKKIFILRVDLVRTRMMDASKQASKHDIDTCVCVTWISVLFDEVIYCHQVRRNRHVSWIG